MFRSTPVKEYVLNGVPIFVKREDLCCPKGSPRFAKIRGLEVHMVKSAANYGVKTFGVLDSMHSKAGWGTAWLCKKMNLNCVLYYPKYKKPRPKSQSQIEAEKLGAVLHAIPAGRQSILWYQARKLFTDTYSHAEMLPNGLTLQECAEATYIECTKTEDEYFGGTVIVSTSTGTIARGVAQFLKQFYPKTKLIIHMGYDRSERTVSKIVDYTNMKIINEGFQYRDSVKTDCPFPCNPYYDLKAWKWLSEQKSMPFREPILFWNIGA